MDIDETKVIDINQYDSVRIDEYNGKYSLQELQKGQNDGVYYMKWVFLSRWKDGKSIPIDKKRPISVNIGGDKSEAIKTLETLLKQVKGE